MAVMLPGVRTPGPLQNPITDEIDRLIDDGQYRRAALLARQYRERFWNDQRLRRRYHGLFLFANARLPEWDRLK